MLKNLHLMMEVAGCPTVCTHCWAQGVRYKMMPLEDIAWTLAEVSRFCEETDLTLGAYPMHEALAHPNAAEMLKIFKPFVASQFQPMTTTGVPLATRDDWKDLLKTIESFGADTFWIHFHGVGETHDKIMSRTGAYKEACLAVERVRSMGFKCGCNVFVTKENLTQLDRLFSDLQRIGIGEMSCEVVVYHPTTRSRHYESIRPELEELLPYVNKIQAATRFWKEKWGNIEACTEAAYVKKALDSDSNDGEVWKRNRVDSESIELVCRNNLDVYSGTAGLYGRFHGNLRKDGVDSVLKSAIAYGAYSSESLYFSTEAIPSIRELAHAVGNPQGKQIHFHAPSMRWRWLDLALAKYRR